MKTPDTRVRFQAPSRHYHRHRVDNANEAWNRWIGNETERKAKGKFATFALWFLVAAAFLGVVGAMCYQLL
jgi:hypothetical protein